MTSVVDLLLQRILVAASEFEFQILAHTNGANPGVAHVFQRVLDGFALRVQHGFFWRNYDFRFHPNGNLRAIVPRISRQASQTGLDRIGRGRYQDTLK